MMQQTKRTQILCVCALMVALATLLSLLKIWTMPYGGSVTLFSMVPLVFLSYRYNLKWGLLSAAAFSVIQMLLGLGGLAGNSLYAIIGSALLDYIAGYTVIGLSGLFRTKIKTPALSMTFGFLLSTFFRYCIHVLSGYLFFRSFAEWYFSQENFTLGALILEHISGPALGIVYSLFYNVLFLLPDTVFAVIGLLLLSASAKKFIRPL